jgi:hypothetical protein
MLLAINKGLANSRLVSTRSRLMSAVLLIAEVLENFVLVSANFRELLHTALREIRRTGEG